MLLDEAKNQYAEAGLRVGLLLLVAAGLHDVTAQVKPGLWVNRCLLAAYWAMYASPVNTRSRSSKRRWSIAVE